MLFLVIAEIISLGDRKLNKEIHDVILEYIARIRLIPAEGVRSGIISPDIDLEAAARMFFSIIQGLVNIWSLSLYDFNLNSKYKPIWELYLKAIV